MSAFLRSIERMETSLMTEHENRFRPALERDEIDIDWFFLVRRPTPASSMNSSACPGIGRRIGDSPHLKTLVPIRYITMNNHSHISLPAANGRSIPLTKSDIDIQKENKFKQIIEQSTVDLSEQSHCFEQCHWPFDYSVQMNSVKQAGMGFPNSTVHKHGNYSAYVQSLARLVRNRSPLFLGLLAA